MKIRQRWPCFGNKKLKILLWIIGLLAALTVIFLGFSLIPLDLSESEQNISNILFGALGYSTIVFTFIWLTLLFRLKTPSDYLKYSWDDVVQSELV